MGYLMKYTATKKTWGGAVNAGESFTFGELFKKDG